MSIKHHPDISNLMCCAAGSQSEAFAAVMASHVAMCSKCRKELARMEVVGSAMFEGIEPQSVTSSAPVPAMRAQEAKREACERPSRSAGSENGIPYPLRQLLGSDLKSLPWKWLAPGVYYVEVPLSKGAKGSLRLLKVAPGVAIPEHGHGGMELTLILAGSYRDELGEFCEGDVSDLDEDAVHRPVADPAEGCICLVAYEKKMRFSGFLARLLQPLTGM